MPNHPELNKYSYINSPALSPKPKREVTIILGGDVMLGRTVMTSSLEKNDYKYPFLEIADFMKMADISFVNLENPIIENCPVHRSGFIFCAPPQMIDGLTYSGVDVVSLANNHTLNHGRDGFDETKKHLTDRNINYVGDGNLIIKEVNGTRFGFVGFEKSQLVNPKLTAIERELVINSNSQVDVLIVSMHWGVEYQDKALDGVRALAEELVDLGADMVVGHHPHWVQDYEKIDGKSVYYSLGNLVFDQMWSEKTKMGMLVKLTFEEGRIIREEFINTYMENWAQPTINN